MRGPKVSDQWEDDPRLQASRPVAADPARGIEASNPDGSFEAMIRMFGGDGAASPPCQGSSRRLLRPGPTSLLLRGVMPDALFRARVLDRDL